MFSRSGRRGGPPAIPASGRWRPEDQGSKSAPVKLLSEFGVSLGDLKPDLFFKKPQKPKAIFLKGRGADSSLRGGGGGHACRGNREAAAPAREMAEIAPGARSGFSQARLTPARWVAAAGPGGRHPPRVVTPRGRRPHLTRAATRGGPSGR